MGCDIHPCVFARLGDEKYHYWKEMAFPPDDRCYPLFEKLAGVRGGYGVTTISEPRGWPEDMPYWDEEDFSRICNGDHTPSWLSLSEMKSADVRDLAAWPIELWNKWIRTMEFVRDMYNLKDDDLRVVFNFDS